MSTKIAINGFGRIGRAAFKLALQKNDLEVVALNDLNDNATLAHLLKYDTVYGRFEGEVGSTEDDIIIDGKNYPCFAEKDPEQLPWKKLGVDIVIESTGIFTTKEKASMHITAGAKHVVISAPAKGGNVETVVMGVNDDILSGQAVISNASCTTNCIAPVVKILHSAFGIKKATMTTIHSYTADQNLIDGAHKDLRRARAAAQNMVPTSTGAAIATTETIPELKGLFDGMAIRVPTPVVSLSDITMLMAKNVTEDEVNKILTEASKEDRFQEVLEVTNDPIVSSDLIGNPHASIVDLSLTKVVDGDLLKVVSWYDNEWGYSNALVKVCQEMGKRL